MKIALLAAMILLPSPAPGEHGENRQPDTAQTYSYSNITWRSFHWDAGSRQFTARISFSNYNYVTHDEPLDEESYNFEFPGVKFDPNTKTFSPDLPMAATSR